MSEKAQVTEHIIDTQNATKYTEFFSWGSDKFGQLGLAQDVDFGQDEELRQTEFTVPNSLSFEIIIEQLSCGDYHAAFLSSEDQVFVIGSNANGQLGVGDNKLPYTTSPILLQPDSFESIIPTSKIPLSVKCGGSHTALLMTSGQLYTWGSGKYGATGLNKRDDSFSPKMPEFEGLSAKSIHVINISCGKRTTMVASKDGRVYGCGDNKHR